MEIISDGRDLNDILEKTYGVGISAVNRTRVSGGDINDAYLLLLSDGRQVFIKENDLRNRDFFRAESEGLKALSDADCIGVPKVHAYGSCEDRSFILMEYLAPGRPGQSFWEDFGHALADLHKADTAMLTSGGRYGFTADNYIGAGPQKNDVKDTWISFFRDCRLCPQIAMAKELLSTDDLRGLERILERLEDFLIEPEHPSLLHGDLWSGNFLVGPDGNAWIIDPAAYVGCAEADIAMTELFGGFSGSFYDAYKESGLLQQGYADRRNLYNLYHMLNHLNLFGGSYLYSVRSIIAGYC